jgi:putative DNA methylase
VQAQPTQRTGRQPPAGLTLLEAGFPFADVSAVARADHFIPDVLYGAHKWWARRPPGVIRALLLASALPSDTDPETFWQLYATDRPVLDGLHIGDPFMGGATTLVEAARLGASVTGVDVDPLAVLIAQEELSRVDDQAEMSEVIRQFLTFMRQACGDLYKTSKADGMPIHYFWLRKVTCSACQAESLMYRTPILARDIGKSGAVVRTRGIEVFCPNCYQLRHLKEGQKSFRCCRRQYRLDKGTFTKFAYVCPNCGKRSKHEQLKTNQLPRVLIAIEETTSGGRRRFRAPTPDDYSCLEKAAVAAAEVAGRIPSTSIGTTDDGRPGLYGVTTVADLFSPRQQAIFVTAFDWINTLEVSEDIRRRLKLGVSNALSTNNMLCSYATDYGRLAPLFAGLRSYAMPILSVELNPLHPDAGRGTLSATMRRIERSLGTEYRRHVYDPRLGQTTKQVFKSRAYFGAVKLSCQSAETGLPNDLGKCDLILTDPPYFDFISYSDLSLFYRAWLWPGSDGSLGGEPIFPHGNNAKEEFSAHLARAFAKAHDALRPEGIFLFTFHSANSEAWDALTDALTTARLIVSATFPVWADARAVAHAHPGNCEWDVVFVCRPATSNVRSRLPDSVDEWLEQLNEASPIGKDITNLRSGLHAARRVNNMEV